jgi:hypothetical protein
MTDYERTFCSRCDVYRGYKCAEHREPSYKQLQQQLAGAEALLWEAVERGEWFDGTYHCELNAHWLDRAKGACGDRQNGTG